MGVSVLGTRAEWKLFDRAPWLLVAPRGGCVWMYSQMCRAMEVLAEVLVEVAMYSAPDYGLEWDACFSLSILSPWPPKSSMLPRS